MRVSCPECGHGFDVIVPRHGQRGQGAHYSDRIKKLGRGHELALEVLRSQRATDFQTGLTLSAVWLCAKEICSAKSLHWPTKQGLSGRLSELAGLGLVRTEHNRIRLVDGESMQFRDRDRSRWFLAKP